LAAQDVLNRNYGKLKEHFEMEYQKLRIEIGT